MTGRPWTRDEMEAAIARGPHKSALLPEAMLHFAAEVTEKVAAGQARTVLWEDIKQDPPPQLKISPIAAVPHSSKPFRSILDLAFALKLQNGSTIPSVNDSTTKLAPHAAVDQLGHCLSRLIHAFGEVGPDEKVFMAKWDVKDGFRRLDCQVGEEFNFAYVLPQPPGSRLSWSSQHHYKWDGLNRRRTSAPRPKRAEMWRLCTPKHQWGHSRHISLNHS